MRPKVGPCGDLLLTPPMRPQVGPCGDLVVTPPLRPQVGPCGDLVLSPPMRPQVRPCGYTLTDMFPYLLSYQSLQNIHTYNDYKGLFARTY
ncbi:hypothetical protein HanRHA438_Chr11g0504281 [Helianthus annuus]|nr:hypothetical protein HanRHA438_Chr11g0504281 [Helianthus annuus]